MSNYDDDLDDIPSDQQPYDSENDYGTPWYVPDQQPYDSENDYGTPWYVAHPRPADAKIS